MLSKQELLHKIGTLLEELQEQYTYLKDENQEANGLDFELFEANASYFASHASLLQKLSAAHSIDTTADYETAEVVFDKEETEITEEPSVTHEAKVDETLFTPATPAAEETVASEEEIAGEDPEDAAEEKDEAPIEEPEELHWPEEESEEQGTESGEPEEGEPEEGEPEEEEPEEGEAEINPEEVSDTIEETPFVAQPETSVEEKEAPTYEQPTIQEVTIEEKFFSMTDEPISEPATTEPLEEDPIVPEPPAPEAPQRPLTLNERLSAQRSQQSTPIWQQNPSGGQPTPQRVTDLKSAISLNDKLLFIRDLFNGYSLAYSEAIELLNRYDNFADADRFLQGNYAQKNNWESKQATVEKLYAILRRKYI